MGMVGKPTKEEMIISLLQQINKSLIQAIKLMEFLVGEKQKR